ncbi:MAG: hypothetical protein LLG97_18825 [Deltaproteobacteria bacterium]|nr:hypothetical protein [Deltaproteobacteria bacterium]
MTEKPNAVNGPEMLIRDCIVRFTASEANSLYPEGGREKAWEEPLVGFSRGDDPLYKWFKEDIGPFYLTPLEIFAGSFPDAKAAAGELTVISWILRHTEKTRADHSREKTLPSERWSRSRNFGEAFNMKLRDHLAAELRAAGHEAVAPLKSPLWRQEKSARYDFASTWSERHAAYAAGLGTFGLCDGLITPLGKAIRCGSVVARVAVPATERPYEDHHAYCLHYFNGSCGKCIKRCPAGAITPEGHDKRKCLAYIDEVTIPFIQSRFGFKAHGCGLCQTGVPCEAKIPVPGRG